MDLKCSTLFTSGLHLGIWIANHEPSSSICQTERVMDRIKSRDATGGDDAKFEIYCEMECAELKLVRTEGRSEVRERQVRFGAGFSP